MGGAVTAFTVAVSYLVWVWCLCYWVASQSTVKTLPGYSGHLPFYLETGYVSVGESDDEKELFYYFIESERDPKDDPLVLWLTGGPGCSGLCGLAFEIGPIAFDVSSFNGSLPSFILRQHSWTKIANVIFIDSPIGTGFSYAKSYNTSDTSQAKDIYTFLRKWLLNHPTFIKNDLYIAGDSYGGMIIPIVALEISNGNEAGVEPQMSLKGYSMGNPITDIEYDHNEKVPFAHGMALIPTEYYELAKSSCSGQYSNPDPNNVQCLNALQPINQCLSDVYIRHILEPSCSLDATNRMLLELDNILTSTEKICSDVINDIMSRIWANNPRVQQALHVRKGKIKKEWAKCNDLGPAYEENVATAIPYHQALTHSLSKAMIYSGDHDMAVPYMATYKWVHHLNLTIDYKWRPWFVNQEVAGYTKGFKNKEFYLTYATVKGAGHTAPEYKPEECLAMIHRWFSSNPL